MLLDTSLVPPAACWMLRAISRVAAPCSSTAAAIAVVTSLISPIVVEMLRIADTAVVVTSCMLTICWRISSVAFAVWLARLFTSEATTAKPRPASPARAASMVALSASRLVCEAMVWIRSTTTLMRAALSASPCMVASVAPASSTALRAISAEVTTWRPISAIDDDSSSVPDDTVCTLTEVSSAAEATALTSALD